MILMARSIRAAAALVTAVTAGTTVAYTCVSPAQPLAPRRPFYLAPSPTKASKDSCSVATPFASSSCVQLWSSQSKTLSLKHSSNLGLHDEDSSKLPSVTVVLLGWLGAKQKHLKKYAEWYTERGINAVTFVIPMKDVISLRAEKRIMDLTNGISKFLTEPEEDGRDKVLLVHTFSNTGWLSYGVILETLLQRNHRNLVDKIKGCIVDSAPVTEADPQVYASGFSAALLAKASSSTQKVDTNNTEEVTAEAKPKFPEVALKAALETFFTNFFHNSNVKARLSQVVDVLSKHQPNCPQLYMYSTADRVIPSKYVESFIDEQGKAGRIVRACNLGSSPHVDHFRNFPAIYSSQLHDFIQECLNVENPN